MHKPKALQLEEGAVAFTADDHWLWFRSFDELVQGSTLDELDFTHANQNQQQTEPQFHSHGINWTIFTS